MSGPAIRKTRLQLTAYRIHLVLANESHKHFVWVAVDESHTLIRVLVLDHGLGVTLHICLVALSGDHNVVTTVKMNGVSTLKYHSNSAVMLVFVAHTLIH